MRNSNVTLAGFISFFEKSVGVPLAWMPDNDSFNFFFKWSESVVNPIFKCVPGIIYQIMVYNLGTHLCLTNYVDDTSLNVYPYATDGNGNNYGWFGWYRYNLGIGNSSPGTSLSSLVSGLITSASDNGTSAGVTLPETLTKLTVSQLSLLSTPFGSAYLGLAQDAGEPFGIAV